MQCEVAHKALEGSRISQVQGETVS